MPDFVNLLKNKYAGLINLYYSSDNVLKFVGKISWLCFSLGFELLHTFYLAPVDPCISGNVLDKKREEPGKKVEVCIVGDG